MTTLDQICFSVMFPPHVILSSLVANDYSVTRYSYLCLLSITRPSSFSVFFVFFRKSWPRNGLCGELFFLFVTVSVKLMEPLEELPTELPVISVLGGTAGTLECFWLGVPTDFKQKNNGNNGTR